ncbi:unnamed protein product, partial [Rotaria socialis]
NLMGGGHLLAGQLLADVARAASHSEQEQLS